MAAELSKEDRIALDETLKVLSKFMALVLMASGQTTADESQLEEYKGRAKHMAEVAAFRAMTDAIYEIPPHALVHRPKLWRQIVRNAANAALASVDAADRRDGVKHGE